MSEKTEPATPKKLREARKKGEVAKSRDVSGAFQWLVWLVSAAYFGPKLVDSFHELWALTVQQVTQTQVAGQAPSSAVLRSSFASLGVSVLLPWLFLLMVSAALAQFAQVGPLLSLKAITPKLDRLNPAQKLKQMVAPKQAVEWFKSWLQLGLIVWLAVVAFQETAPLWATLPNSPDGPSILRVLGSSASVLGWKVIGILIAVALADLVYQRWQFQKDQRMSKDEVKREFKESEGDPHAKQQRNRMHREIVEHSTLEEVRRADVLVVNPTHLAIALRYDDDEDEDDRAPEVTAKGQDGLAKRMIDAAREAGVPIMRDVPLARALWDMEVGDEIPEALYEAVAAILKAAWEEREAEEEAENPGAPPAEGDPEEDP